jgi:hypothetical protein
MTLVPADTVRLVRVVRPADRRIVLLAMETVRPWSDTVLVSETGPVNEFTLVALMLDVPEDP